MKVQNNMVRISTQWNKWKLGHNGISDSILNYS